LTRAGSGVPKVVAHGAQLADRSVQFVRFLRKHLPVKPRTPVRAEHERDLIERGAGRTPEGNQCQTLQHAGIEETAWAAPADGSDQPLFLVEPQDKHSSRQYVALFMTHHTSLTFAVQSRLP